MRAHAGFHAILACVAAQEKPRILQGGKDMVLSLGLLVLLMLVGVGFTGLCTFNPGAPEGGPVQEVDAKTFTEMEARAVTFPVRYPQMPDTWVTNSARRAMIAGEPAPVVGWVTPDQGYVALTQTGAPLEQALRDYDSEPRELADTRTIAGQDVGIYSSDFDDVRDIWAVELDDVSMLFAGAGSDEEFTQLITSALESDPLPTN